jgi:hypothetical protein
VCGHSAAQTAVNLVAPARGPYVPLYSPCRDRAPDDPAAQRFQQAVRTSQPYEAFADQLEALEQQPPAQWRPVDAELWFLLLRQMEFQLGFEPRDRLARQARILAGLAQGQGLVQRHGGDAAVRCAHLATTLWLSRSQRLGEHFSDAQRSSAREAYLSFLEGARRGAPAVEVRPYLMDFTLGQLLLDQGFGLLPDGVAAAPWFERGAAHLLDAAAAPDDERYISNWQRYAFMLAKLAPAQQQGIVGRLLDRYEALWLSPTRPPATAWAPYVHLLDFGGRAALDSARGHDAVELYRRHAAALRRLRQLEPDDPNHVGNAALGQLLLGDAQTLTGDLAAAARAYDEAARVYGGADAVSRDLLDRQDFAIELAARTAAGR